jgi:hypothetical protein
MDLFSVALIILQGVMMIMLTRSYGVLAAAILLASGSFGYAQPAQAGNVSAAQLGCYVDTFALDPLLIGACGAAWTPSTANNPTRAYFQIVGLSAGSYSCVWRNLETGGIVACSGATCSLPIATETRGDGYAAMSVTITDLSTGASKIVSASAEYIDAWN